MTTKMFLQQSMRFAAAAALAGLMGLASNVHAQHKPAAKAPATPKPAASKPATSAAHPGTGSTAAGHSTAGANGAAGHSTAGATGHSTTATAGRGGTAAGGHTSAAAGTTRTSSGGSITRNASGKPTTFKSADGNKSASFNSKGQVHEVHAGNTTITHGPGGSRRIVSEGPNHTRFVADAHGHGYVQHQYMYHGHAYQGRTYYRNGVVYHEYYRPYYYNGVYLSGYYPAAYYSPAFYGWAYNPWAAPVAYSWGWGAAPWYGVYAPYYFAPYPVYATASLWLTDYLISSSLQSAYAAGVAAGAAGAASNRPFHNQQGGAHLVLASYSPSGSMFQPPAAAGAGVALTPEIKKEISDEVALTLDEEKAEAAQGSGADATPHGIDKLMTDGKSHVFVSSDPIDVQTSDGQDCGLTAGDVLQMNASPTAKDSTYAVQVLASKSSDCQKGATINVTLENLQDMHNSLMSTVDQGLGDLQKKAGQNGLPAAPAGSTTTTTAPYASAAPADDPNGAQELAKVAADGTQADQQVVNEASGGSTEAAGDSQPAASVAAAPSSSGPVTIALGQTPAQVTAAKGQPKQIINLGAKQIYVYSDMKVYFGAGKVVDVQ